VDFNKRIDVHILFLLILSWLHFHKTKNKVEYSNRWWHWTL